MTLLINRKWALGERNRLKVKVVGSTPVIL
jgi:hypothetical protein